VKMLQNCPKLQALSISKVGWSHWWRVIDFCWFFFILFKYFHKSYFFCWQWTHRSTARGRDDWKYPYHVPKCISSHLKTCAISGYNTVEGDFRFATYILQNARFLQVMTIHYDTYANESRHNPQFLKDLSSCQMISPACKLSVVCH
jgi:hypothetical protein